MGKPSHFKDVPAGPIDPMFDLKVLADKDLSPEKVDLGVGVYRDDNGGYYELQTVKQVDLF